MTRKNYMEITTYPISQSSFHEIFSGPFLLFVVRSLLEGFDATECKQFSNALLLHRIVRIRKPDFLLIKFHSEVGEFLTFLQGYSFLHFGHELEGCPGDVIKWVE